MRIKVPEQNWEPFLKDLGRRRIGWRSRVERVAGSVVDPTAAAFCRLENISVLGTGPSFGVEIVLAGTGDEKLRYSVLNPVGVVYLAQQGRAGGIIEIEELDGKKIRVHLEDSDLKPLAKGRALAGSQGAVI